MKLEFVIPGEPVAQGRPKFSRRGAFVTAYTPQKSRDFRDHVQESVRGQLFSGYEPTIRALSVKMIFCLPIPASWSKKKQAKARLDEVPHISKPDLSNMVKAIEDAFNGLVWKDDSQIICETTYKRYSVNPRTLVYVEEFQPEAY